MSVLLIGLLSAVLAADSGAALPLVTVQDFTVGEDLPALRAQRDLLTDTVGAALQNSGRFRIAGRAHARELAAKGAMAPKGCETLACGLSVAQRAGAAYLVRASVVRLASKRCKATVTLIDMARRQVVDLRSDAGACGAAAAGGRLAALAGLLGGSPPPPQASPEDYPPSPEASPSSTHGMVRVPAGSFWRGCSTHDTSCEADERPGRNLELREFWIDAAPVTVAQYRRCVEAGACTKAQANAVDSFCNEGARGRENHPINCVDWYQATSYCASRGKRLPNEAEWEKAARGDDGRVFPWGDEAPACARAVWNHGGNGCGKGTTGPVGRKPAGASPYGALDMAGNVWEWVYDTYDPAFYLRAPGRDPVHDGPGVYRVLRGGSFHSDLPGELRAGDRNANDPSLRGDTFGFRCAR
jgi:formylglycine-generating enzyme required for sulfatase activity